MGRQCDIAEQRQKVLDDLVHVLARAALYEGCQRAVAAPDRARLIGRQCGQGGIQRLSVVVLDRLAALLAAAAPACGSEARQ